MSFLTDNTGSKYIGEAIDSIINYKANKKKRLEADSELNEFLNGIESAKLPAKPQLDEVPEYERLTYTAPTNEEIESAAQSELAAYKQAGENGIAEESEAKARRYAADAQAAEREHIEAVSAAESNYATAKQNVDDDMLKRGLARSSIAANKKTELERSEAEAKAALAAQYNNRINEINGQISSLNEQRQQALNEFNLAYAAKLTQRISELKSERDKRESEVIKYNNTLTQKEHEQKVDKTVKENALYESALKQKQTEEQMQNLTAADYDSIYVTIAQTLRKINQSDARDLVLNDPRIAQAVSPQYYYKLYAEFCR